MAKKQPLPAAPGRGTIGINVPPDSAHRHLRTVSRMIRLIDAIAKNERKKRPGLVEGYQQELQELGHLLLASGREAPQDRDGLCKLRGYLLEQIQSEEA